MVDKDTLQILKELSDKIEFAEYFLKDELPKIENRLKELSNPKIMSDEYAHKINDRLSAIEKRLADLDQAIEKSTAAANDSLAKAAKEIEKQKDFLINIQDQIEKKYNKLQKTNSFINGINLMTAISIFIVAAIGGAIFGYLQTAGH